MTKVPSNPDIEEWLSSCARSYRLLTVAEYKELARAWKAAFEALYTEGRVRWSARAEVGVRDFLPCDGYIFNLPDYQHQPSTHGPGTTVFAYHAQGLIEVDLLVANELDAILTDDPMSFTFLGTHEHESMCHPALIIRSSTHSD